MLVLLIFILYQNMQMYIDILHLRWWVLFVSHIFCSIGTIGVWKEDWAWCGYDRLSAWYRLVVRRRREEDRVCRGVCSVAMLRNGVGSSMIVDGLFRAFFKFSFAAIASMFPTWLWLELRSVRNRFRLMLSGFLSFLSTTWVSEGVQQRQLTRYILSSDFKFWRRWLLMRWVH